MTKRWAGSAEAALLLMLAFVGGAQAAEPQCTFPAKILDMGHPLHRTWAAISTGRPLSLVALGSSSTAGAGASTVDASYPTRLRARLSSLFGHPVIVVNRGRNGAAWGTCCSACRLRSFLSTGCGNLAARNECFVDRLGSGGLR